WSVAGEEEEWDLLRRSKDKEFELVASGLRKDGAGTITWTDAAVEEGLFYEYRLESEGGLNRAETGWIEIPVANARLYQNHPNPFNPGTTIAFTIPGQSSVRRNALLSIYDVRGILVKTLVNGPVAGGRHEVSWDGRNSRGIGVSSGVYFAKFATGGYSSVRKMVLVR
ncbi:MAG: T9SS type A sorting domain-containing protein, partial [Candidatus Krumholzibacteria bacterium]|nr:T9SS type A sorting domain-containing protein [Candidatus Krumholzibacteria bacterium]